MNNTDNKFWKTLKTIAKISLGVVAFAAVASLAAYLPFLGTATVTLISTIIGGASLLGIGSLALTGVTALGAGLVNGARYIFSKKYRNQVKDRRAARKQEREQNRTNSKNNLWNKLFGKKKSKGNSDPAPEQNAEPETEPEKNAEPETEPEQTAAPKKSGKAAGMYDSFSSDNKVLYDNIIKKNKPAKMFDGYSREQAVIMKAIYNDYIASCKKKINNGETLTPQEENELVHATALRTKISAYIKNKESLAQAGAFVDEADKTKAIDTVKSRIVK